MNILSFFGPMTMATAAGSQPMGSVFGGVPSPNYLLAQDLPRLLPPASNRPTASAPDWKYRVSFDALPHGCGA